jgi:hypothetical protein
MRRWAVAVSAVVAGAVSRAARPPATAALPPPAFKTRAPHAALATNRQRALAAKLADGYRRLRQQQGEQTIADAQQHKLVSIQVQQHHNLLFGGWTGGGRS